jgi:hypothetical protein
MSNTKRALEDFIMEMSDKLDLDYDTCMDFFKYLNEEGKLNDVDGIEACIKAEYDERLAKMTPERALEILNGNRDIWSELGYKSHLEYWVDFDVAWNMAMKSLMEKG